MHPPSVLETNVVLAHSAAAGVSASHPASLKEFAQNAPADVSLFASKLIDAGATTSVTYNLFFGTAMNGTAFVPTNTAITNFLAAADITATEFFTSYDLSEKVCVCVCDVHTWCTSFSRDTSSFTLVCMCST